MVARENFHISCYRIEFEIGFAVNSLGGNDEFFDRAGDVRARFGGWENPLF